MKYFVLLALLLAGCQSSSSTQSLPSSDAKHSNHAQAETIVWQAGSATLGDWQVATTYQCGTPVNAPGSPTFYFDLKKDGTNCGRNQMLPVDASGNLIRLQDGQTYTWTFRYVDGNRADKPNGMGLDTGADPEANVWQIHGYNEQDSPCTGLNFDNGAYYGRAAGQEWDLSDCSGKVWFGAYTPQEKDNWKIQATISEGPTGETKLWRNGVLMVDSHGANYHNSTCGSTPCNPWSNWGIYKWRWELNPSGSNMTEVQMTIHGMTLTTP